MDDNSCGTSWSDRTNDKVRFCTVRERTVLICQFDESSGGQGIARDLRSQKVLAEQLSWRQFLMRVSNRCCWTYIQKRRKCPYFWSADSLSWVAQRKPRPSSTRLLQAQVEEFCGMRSSLVGKIVQSMCWPFASLWLRDDCSILTQIRCRVKSKWIRQQTQHSPVVCVMNSHSSWPNHVDRGNSSRLVNFADEIFISLVNLAAIKWSEEC